MTFPDQIWLEVNRRFIAQSGFLGKSNRWCRRVPAMGVPHKHLRLLRSSASENDSFFPVNY
jgi:hypothetical protein